MFDLEKPIVHVTHRRADPDSFAGVYWGVRVFGGCSIVDEPRIAVKNLMKKLGFEARSCSAITTILYDTNRYDDVPFHTERIVIVDHHPWMDPTLETIAQKIVRRPRASLSMNLYDMSVDAGFQLSDDVLLVFALALVTDTAMLRTASSEELLYLSKFLDGRRMEEVIELAFGGVVDPTVFSKEISAVEKLKGVCWGSFSSDDHFMFFADTFMYVMECDVVVGVLGWGVWVYTKKDVIQKVYPVLKRFEKMGYRRRGGRLFGFRNALLLVEKISEVI